MFLYFDLLKVIKVVRISILLLLLSKLVKFKVTNNLLHGLLLWRF